jgi:D-amino peptidase
MKLYIMTDMEGLSGVRCVEQTQPGSPKYEEGRRFLVSDINAAIEGALEAGVKEIVVNDGHGGGPHFQLDDLHPAARYERPRGGKLPMPALDESFGAFFMVGAHPMAGTLNGFLDHTQSSVHWFNYSINGRLAGELAQMGAIAGYFGVPTVLVTGDHAACEEAKSFFPGVETVAVKVGIGRSDAQCLHPKHTAGLIRDAAKRAIGRAGEIEPYRVSEPVELVLQFTRSDYADGLAQRSDVERLDARTIRKVVPTGKDIIAF